MTQSLLRLMDTTFCRLQATLLDALLPRFCAHCEAPTHDLFCSACLPRIRFLGARSCRRCGTPWSLPARPCPACHRHPPAFDGLEAVARYDTEPSSPFRSAIRRLKYESRRDLARPLSRLLLSRLRPLARPFDLVVPVPLHGSRLRERGFNQAALLAREPAAALRAPLQVDALERSRPTPSQTGLSGIERKRNVHGAIRPRPGLCLDGLRILLVDDVVTSGATVSACTLALRRAGARSVGVLCAGRAVLPDETQA